jgi:hypothetical protein
MTHEEAIENFVAEGYLLGELTEAEGDAFEKHYFDCVSCFEDVVAGLQLITGVREMEKNRPPCT